MPGTHSRYSPSALSRALGCPASIPATQGLTQPTSEWAEEGTRAHALLETCIVEDRYPRPDEGDNAEMRNAIGKVLDAVFAQRRYGYWTMPEMRLPMSYGTEQFGTVDILQAPALNSDLPLRVEDLKYGYLPVDPVENWQLMAYADAAAEKAAYEGTVEIVVHQPRVHDGPQVWKTDTQHLAERMRHVDTVVKGIEVLGQHPEAWPHFMWPSEDTCRFCALRGRCPAQKDHLERKVLGGFAGVQHFEDITGPTSLPNPEMLTPAQLFEVESVAGWLDSWLGHVKDRAKDAMVAGALSPGRKIVKPHARSGWLPQTQPKKAAETFAAVTGRDPFEFMKLKSLSDVREMLAEDAREAGFSGDEAEGFVEQNLRSFARKNELKGYQIVDVSDKRPDASARSAFKGVKTV